MNSQSHNPHNPKAKALSLLFGGVLPVIAFTVIEEYYGITAGLIAGLIFGLGELIYEYVRYKKISTMTWVGNGSLLILGAISLWLNEGIWFKLQPAILEFFMFLFLIGSWFLKKPFLKLMIEKQNPESPHIIKDSMSGITLRLGFFFLIHTLIAVHAAFYWSTEAWAILKGVGLTLSMILYMVIEMYFIKKRLG
ncbi:MAG: inner membrane-spanning protein YciB [Pseudobdellovibrio sp.]